MKTKLYVIKDMATMTNYSFITTTTDKDAYRQYYNQLSDLKMRIPSLDPTDFKLYYLCTINDSSEDFPAVEDTNVRELTYSQNTFDACYNAFYDERTKLLLARESFQNAVNNTSSENK